MCFILIFFDSEISLVDHLIWELDSNVQAFVFVTVSMLVFQTCVSCGI